jgi:putative membrane protein
MRTGWHAAVLAAALAAGGVAHAQGYGSGSGRSTGSTGTTGGPGEAGTTTGGTGAGGAASSGAAKGGKLDEKLQEAAQALHASNQGEIAAGKAALSAAQSPDVKRYAQRMVDDHSKTDAQLQQIAQRMGVSLKGKAFDEKLKDAQEELKEAQAKKGAEFDRAYMKMMVDEHEDDVEDVEKAAKRARDEQQVELALFLDTTHKHLQMHLDEAKRVEQSLDAKGTGRAQGSPGSGAATAPSSSARGGEMGPGGAAGAHGGSAGGSGGTHPGSHTDTGGATRPGGSGAVGGGTSGGSTGSSK